MTAAIALEGLSKSYGARRGIENVTLSVEPGTIVGLVGPNGAGKSTTLRTMLGLLRPTSGKASILGLDAQRDGARCRAQLGYVPGENQFDPGLTAREVLAFRARCFPGDHTAAQRALVERFELELDARADDLSLGNKKKLALVAALQQSPKVLVLDEPTNGLDPVMQHRLFETLEAAATAGAAVLFSSHVLSEVQRVCRTVAVLSEGRLVALEDIEALRRKQLRRVHVTAQRPLAGLATVAGVSAVVHSREAATFLHCGPLNPLLTTLTGLDPVDLRIEEPSLEEIVLQHYVKGVRS